MNMEMPCGTMKRRPKFYLPKLLYITGLESYLNKIKSDGYLFLLLILIKTLHACQHIKELQ